MRRAKAFLALASLALAFALPASAQQARGDVVLSLAQAERSATDLRRGMSADDVRKLLGKPKRTGLKDDGIPSATSQGALQWTYVWSGAGGPNTLHVDFASESPEQWRVRSWEWAAY